MSAWKARVHWSRCLLAWYLADIQARKLFPALRSEPFGRQAAPAQQSNGRLGVPHSTLGQFAYYTALGCSAAARREFSCVLHSLYSFLFHESQVNESRAELSLG